MTDDLYDRKLAWFKQNENPEPVLLVADHDVSIRIALAWSNTDVGRALRLSRLSGDSEHQVWEWLWENADYSREELVRNSAQSKYGFEQKLLPLVGNRALYPDGTVNSFVRRYLRERVLQLFDSKSKRTR